MPQVLLIMFASTLKNNSFPLFEYMKRSLELNIHIFNNEVYVKHLKQQMHLREIVSH